MSHYIIRRIIQSIPILIGISIISFLIVVLAPGDPLATMYPPYVLQKIDQDLVRHQLGLDQPLPVQYFSMMKKLVTGELNSFSERRPVIEAVMERLPPRSGSPAWRWFSQLSYLFQLPLSLPRTRSPG